MIKAIVTIYYPSSAVRENIERILNQVDVVWICDNSPKVDNRDLFENLDKLNYVWFGENRGLSLAFNTILKDPAGQWEDDDYIVFFDQDSSVGPDHMRNLVKEYELLRGEGHAVGCLGPVFFNTSNGQIEKPRMRKYLNNTSYAVSSIITSSMLCKYGDIREIGFWNEDIFLDMADWDLCWRLQKGRKLSCMTEVTVLQHSLGVGEKKIGPFSLRVGKPFREYYQIRDCLYLFTKPYTPFKYRIRFLAMIFVRSPLHILFQDAKMDRLKYILKGLRDFIRRKHGPLDA